MQSQSSVSILKPSQCIIPRNSVLIDKKQLEVRFNIKLPASNGRRIYGSSAASIIETIVEPALKKLYHETLPDTTKEELCLHVQTYLDQLQLRSLMKQEGSCF